MTLRLFWFIVGAGSATWWMKHHEERTQQPRSHGAIGWNAHCHGTPPDEKKVQAQSIEPLQHEPQFTVRRWSWGGNGWDDQQKKMDEFEKGFDQFHRAVGDFSEATLDSMLTTMVGLKSKLAEHRAQREADMERLRKDGTPRWV